MYIFMEQNIVMSSSRVLYWCSQRDDRMTHDIMTLPLLQSSSWDEMHLLQGLAQHTACHEFIHWTAPTHYFHQPWKGMSFFIIFFFPKYPEARHSFFVYKSPSSYGRKMLMGKEMHTFYPCCILSQSLLLSSILSSPTQWMEKWRDA